MQKAQRKLYGRHATNMMKTDVQEHDDHYEVYAKYKSEVLKLGIGIPKM